MIISKIIWLEFLALFYQTNLVLEADIVLLNLTEPGEPIGKIEWETVYEDSLNVENQYFSLT